MAQAEAFHCLQDHLWAMMLVISRLRATQRFLFLPAIQLVVMVVQSVSQPVEPKQVRVERWLYLVAVEWLGRAKSKL
jgi:hypothetical protein